MPVNNQRFFLHSQTWIWLILHSMQPKRCSILTQRIGMRFSLAVPVVEIPYYICQYSSHLLLRIQQILNFQFQVRFSYHAFSPCKYLLSVIRPLLLIIHFWLLSLRQLVDNWYLKTPVPTFWSGDWSSLTRFFDRSPCLQLQMFKSIFSFCFSYFWIMCNDQIDTGRKCSGM